MDAPDPAKSVFVNCPYDEQYRPLMDAIILATVACDLVPRTAKDTGENRIARICELLAACRYSIHDLTRCRGEGEMNYARMNMPLELGMAIEKRYVLDGAGHEWLALVPEGHGYLAFGSDLAGYDPVPHNETQVDVIAKVMSWLAGRRVAPRLPPRRVAEALPRFAVARARLDADWLDTTPWYYLVNAAHDVLSS